jgi:hypothetical protein
MTELEMIAEKSAARDLLPQGNPPQALWARILPMMPSDRSKLSGFRRLQDARAIVTIMNGTTQKIPSMSTKVFSNS